jgi:hypothetical protein
MSTGGSTAAIVAAAGRRAERRLVERLRQAGATSAKAAASLPSSELSRLESSRLARLQTRGAIVEPQPGRFYLDEPQYEAYRRGRQVRGIAILAAVLAVGALALAVARNMSR